MHLILETYDIAEMMRIRSELDARGIRFHVSDEFTYAIPGMPGAEKPCGLWVMSEEDAVIARRMVTDLLGAHRVSPDPAEQGADEAGTGSGEKRLPMWAWGALTVALLIGLARIAEGAGAPNPVPVRIGMGD